MPEIFWTTNADESYRKRWDERESLEKLLESVYSENPAIRVEDRLLGGRSRNDVLRVAILPKAEQNATALRTEVVKTGLSKELEKEKANYRLIEQLDYDYFLTVKTLCPHPEDAARAAIVYSDAFNVLGGLQGKVQTYEDYCRDNLRSQPERVFDVADRILQSLDRLRSAPASQDAQAPFQLPSDDVLKTRVNDLADAAPNAQTVTIVGHELPNPVKYLSLHTSDHLPSEPVLIHGDLNPRNILVVNDIPCFIDYSHVKFTHSRIADLVKLELELINTALSRDSEVQLYFVSALWFATRDNFENNEQWGSCLQDDYLENGLHLLCQIRRKAHELLGSAPNADRLYAQSAVQYSLSALRYDIEPYRRKINLIACCSALAYLYDQNALPSVNNIPQETQILSVHFGHYLQKIRAMRERDNELERFSELYIALSCREMKPKAGLRPSDLPAGVDISSFNELESDAEADEPPTERPARNFILDWLGEYNHDFCLVLANFGMGKTWLTKRILYDSADRFLADPKEARLPILLTLRGQEDKPIEVIALSTTVRLNFFRIDVTQGIFVACEWK